MRPISNLNSVSIKNYGAQAETLAIIRELTKLGLIKTKSKSNKERKQESDMVGYTKSLEGKSSLGFPLRIVQGAMTQQQIEDINRENAAKFAVLRSEVEQQRLEDIQAQQGQRFSDIQRFGSELGRIVNPLVERFRGAQEEGAGQRPNPFTSQASDVIYLGDVQETQDVPMSRTANPNAPEYTSEFAETVFPQQETGNISTAPPNLQPREKVGGDIEEEQVSPRPKQMATKITRKEYLKENGLGQIPSNTKSTTLQEMAEYYRDFSSALGYEVRNQIIRNKSEMYKEMVSIVDDEISSANL